MRSSRTLGCLCFVALLAAGLARSESDRVDIDQGDAEKRLEMRALLVGVSKYPGYPMELPGIKESASMLPRFLMSMGRKRTTTVVALLDERASGAAMRAGLEDLATNPEPARQVLFVFGGFQWQDPMSKKIYLVPQDGNPKNVVPLDDVKQKLLAAKAEARYLYLYSCFGPSMKFVFGGPTSDTLDWQTEMIPAPAGGFLAVMTCAPEEDALTELKAAPVSPAKLPASKTPSVHRPGLTFLGTNDKGFEEYKNERDDSVLIYVPGGTFCFGHGGQWIDQIPRRKISLSPYLVGKYEVSLGQYKKFCSQTPYRLPKLGWWQPKDNEPIEEIMWADSVAYCAWAGLRLPSEAEWEYAARGNDGRKYPWGNEPTGTGGVFRANLFGEDDLGKSCDPFLRTAPVDSFPQGASPFGCLNMLGNVLEWCADRYDPYYYVTAESTDPQGPSSGKLRTRRGSSWNTKPQEAFAVSRSAQDPTEQWEDTGFRVACTP